MGVGGVGIRDSPGVDAVNLISGETTRATLPSFFTPDRSAEVTEETEKMLENEGTDRSPKDLLMLHNHSSFIQDDKIVVVGGGGNCFSFGTHLNGIWEIDLRKTFPSIFS